MRQFAENATSQPSVPRQRLWKLWVRRRADDQSLATWDWQDELSSAASCCRLLKKEFDSRAVRLCHAALASDGRKQCQLKSTRTFRGKASQEDLIRQKENLQQRQSRKRFFYAAERNNQFQLANLPRRGSQENLPSKRLQESLIVPYWCIELRSEYREVSFIICVETHTQFAVTLDACCELTMYGCSGAILFHCLISCTANVLSAGA